MHRRHISLLIVATLLLIGSVHAQEPRVAPANDYFSNRRVLSAREVMNASLTIGSAQDATTQSGEPMPSCGAASDTVWFEINAPYQIDLVVDTFESSLNSGASNNTVIAVYRSVFPTPALGSLLEYYCSSGGSGAGSFTWVPLAAGKSYLQVGSQISLSSASIYKVNFGSRYQLLANTDFGDTVKVLTPWTVGGTGTTGDKIVCNGTPVDCKFRFKTGPGESSRLKYKLTGLETLPHDSGPTRYSEFHLSVDHDTDRLQTNATASVKVTFLDGSKDKGSRSLDQAGAIYVDPPTGATPIKVVVKIKHTGTSGDPLYINKVLLRYAPGASGRDLLPIPAGP
ncbi:MAG: hypothetical protein IT298_04460 [Chloroflexi bacterium]|nr:hypothetical protein [Chloroflexota bacterium]